MKKILYIIAAASIMVFASCEDQLDTENYTKANTSNYPQNVTQANQILAGVYNNLNVAAATPQETFYYMASLASDDQLGGGGDNDILMQAVDLLCNSASNMTEQFWTDRYAGINRANNAIAVIPNCTGFADNDQKNQMIGEAHFLRAFYYYELASMYGNIPLVTSTDQGANNIPQASADSIWGQIVYDCKWAADNMPAKSAKAQGLADGHVDKYAAEALLARAYLFYAGFYKGANDISSTDISMTLPDKSTIKKADVIKYIDDCVTNSGYSLVPTFQNLWAYTNRCTKDTYSYTKGQNYKWVEDDANINPEAMFKIKFSQFASWSTTIGYANQYCLHFSMRGGQALDKTYPFSQGWGAGPVAENLWNDWVAYDKSVNGGDGISNFKDPRIKASICHIPEELPNYTKGGWSDYVQETDYFEKKQASISCPKSSGSGYHYSFECLMYSSSEDGSGWGSGVYDNSQLDNFHDLVLIRFADVLLMQSELEGSVTGINKVRARAGLSPIAAYSLSALQNERRWELCFEGIRWNDMRRWGDSYCETALQEQIGTNCYHAGSKDTNTPHNGGYVARYKATKGFFKIPEEQINLANGVLKQNAGWGSSDNANYSSWKSN